MSYATDEKRARCDRVLELFEKGMRPAVIAERLGMKLTNVSGAIKRAKARREKAAYEEAPE